MDNAVNFERLVLELLGEHSCVTLPGLGSFIYRETQASSNTFTLEIRPAVRTIFFNPAIASDDGLLANAIREKAGMNFNSAQKTVLDFIAEIKTKLEEKRNLAFGKLGNFFLNAENQIFFFPSPSLNLSRETFGLPVIKLDEVRDTRQSVVTRPQPVAEEKTVPHVSELTVEEPEAEEAHVIEIDEPHHSRKRSWIWKVAAAIALLMMAGTAYYFGRSYFMKPAPAAQKSNLDTPAAQIPADTSAIADTSNTEDSSNINAPAYDSIENENHSPQVSSTAMPPASFEQETVKEAEPKVEPAPAPQDMFTGKGKYFVVAGKYMDPSLAELETRTWASKGIHSKVFKSEKSSLYKVITGRFNSREEADKYIQSLAQPAKFSISIIKDYQ